MDVKVFNEPLHLFSLMHEIISAQPNWEVDLAPRILLGLWHPRFIPHAKTILPYCKRSYIGVSLPWARQYFWDSCEVFSVNFSILATREGGRFREECKRAGKKVAVWTVNEPVQMLEVRTVITPFRGAFRVSLFAGFARLSDGAWTLS